MKFWHGGQAGLRVGSMILPPSESGAANTLYEHGTSVVARRDRVYVTTNYTAAMMFAAMHPSKGGVYEVEPQGACSLDPDCSAPGLSWECERARIVSARGVSNLTRRKVLRALTKGSK